MKKTKKFPVVLSLGVLCLLTSISSSSCLGASTRHFLQEQIPAAVSKLRVINSLPTTNQLQLAISLPARNPAELDALLKNIYDPASSSYRQYLTPAQFAKQFGASEADYQALIHFAEANGLRVTGTHPNRLVLDVAGPVANIEKMFQVKMGVYQHPNEHRTFFAPDAVPSLDASLPLTGLTVSGLDNYSLPHPANLHPIAPGQSSPIIPNAGSGPSGTYMGRDFRLAYFSGTTLNGSGQSVALLQFDGYYLSDITSYVSTASLPVIPANILINVPVNGGVSTPGSGGIEVSLDIEMALSMATNLSKIYVYEAPNPTPWVTMLSKIANDNLAQQIGCSWGGGSANPNSAAEVIFKQMAAQGQSFFCASGDNDAFVGGATFPDDSPNITMVGGTTLTTSSRGGTYVSETTWNAGLDSSSGKYIGTGGGISTIYAIPFWQQAISSFSTNGGSTTARNVPDVALTADNVYVKYGNGSATTVTGTSCAAPLWAGLMALVNQKAAASGLPSAGFINPAVYEIANESIYKSVFNDITTGNNAWPSSPSAFYAVPGYDLCTGLGTPKGTNLINALAIPDPLVIVTNIGFSAVGTPSGTFNISSYTYTLTNIGSATLAWSLINTSAWLSASSTGGTLAVGGSTTVAVSLNNVASNLVAGAYAASVSFSNVTGHVGHFRAFTLKTSDPLVVLPASRFFFTGPPGGPFTPGVQVISLTNPSSSTLNWGINSTSVWFNVSPTSGSLAPGAQVNLTFATTLAASNLSDGLYTANFQTTNLTSQYVQLITANLAAGIIQNGGFEYGDFTGWSLKGNTSVNGSLFNGVVSSNSLTDGSGPTFIHSGGYGAFLGDTNLAILSQSIPTKPGQSYLLSFWINNPITGIPQQLAVNWNTNSASSNQIYLLNNPAVLPWTNLTFIVNATETNTSLQFSALNPTNAFGLDDITLIDLAPPVFTSQPTSLTIVSGANAAFSATANGLAPLSYQWLQNGTNLVNGGAISGATGNLLTLTAATITNSGNYTLIVTNNYGAITSSVAILTVNTNQPTIPPGISNVVANLDGSFTLNLLGSPGFTYVLQAATNLVPPINWQPIVTNVINTNGLWQFSDTKATNYPQQFYRLKFVQ